MKSDLHLDWDSEFFGFKVARLDITNLQEDEIENQISILKKMNYRLVYIFNRPKELDIITSKFLKNLVDTKLTFRKSISSISKINNSELAGIHKITALSDDLMDLAILSGQYSRFRLDPKFEKGVFERLYLQWIKNSVEGKNSDFVIGYYSKMKLIGMATLKLYETYAKIGLISVSDQFQKSGIGKCLMSAVENICAEKSIDTLLVETQMENKIACRFYEHNGFHVSKEEHIYHVWL